jgi:[NiFe] hydrogenase diaphorase moiety large subunit
MEQECLKRDIAAWVACFGQGRSSLIRVLQEIQSHYSHISSFAMQVVAECLDIRPAEVYSVASFYPPLAESRKGRFTIRLCRALSCDLAEKDRISSQLVEELGISFGHTTADGLFTLEWANCLGMCDQGPALLVNERIYTRVTPARIGEIIAAYRQASQEETPHKTPTSQITAPHFGPLDAGIGLKAALQTPRQTLLKELPVIAAPDDSLTSVICNTDESGPGAYMNRVLLAEQAGMLIEGMTIAGYATSATQGIIYLRSEYAYLRAALEATLNEYRQRGWLGNDILGQAGVQFDVTIEMGLGTFVGHEESALIEVLEGKRGEPRDNPSTLTATDGRLRLFIIRNIDFFTQITRLCAKQPQRTDNSTFAVSGDCAAPGIYEFSVGTTIAQIVETVGGADAKAVQIGGLAEPCIPAHDFSRQISAQDLAGTRSVVVFGPQRDMLLVARGILCFYATESCGQCTPCREGNARLIRSIDTLIRRSNLMQSTGELRSLAETMQLASKCSLGQAAPNALLSIIQHFPNG